MKTKILSWWPIAALCASFAVNAAEAPATPLHYSPSDTIVILGAVPQEIPPFVDAMKDAQKRSLQGIPYWQGHIDGKPVVQEVIDMLKLGGPIAAAECKRLVRRVQQVSVTEGFIEMAGWSRRMFLSAEAAEGMAAFREKRSPAWVSGEGKP